MNQTEIHQTIARLRREMPHNQTAMDLCEACEELLAGSAKAQPLTRAQIQKNYRERKRQKESSS